MIKEGDIFVRMDDSKFYVSEINSYPTVKKTFVFYRLRKVGDHNYPYHDYTSDDLYYLFKRDGE